MTNETTMLSLLSDENLSTVLSEELSKPEIKRLAFDREQCRLNTRMITQPPIPDFLRGLLLEYYKRTRQQLVRRRK